MKNLAALGILFAAGLAHAEISTGGEVDVSSRYLDRGLAGSTGAVVQPGAFVGWEGLNASTLLTLDPAAGSRPSDAAFDLGYALELGDLSFTPHITATMFPDGGPTSVEVAGELAYLPGGVGPCVAPAVESSAPRGAAYLPAGVCFEAELTAWLTVESSASVAWANAEYHVANHGVERSGFDVGQVDASATLAVGDGTWLRLHGTGSRLLPESLRASSTEPDLYVVGAAVGFEM